MSTELLEIEPSKLTSKSLIGRTLGERDRTSMRIAALRGAAHRVTELDALAYTEVYLSGLSPLERTGARRAAGICAKHPRARQPEAGSRFNLGVSLRLLHHAATNSWPGTGETRNQIEAQVASLPRLDVEGAAAIFDGLISRCAENGVAVDFYSLNRTLTGWGNGITAQSRRTRTELVQDFYSPLPRGTGKEPTTPPGATTS